MLPRVAALLLALFLVFSPVTALAAPAAMVPEPPMDATHPAEPVTLDAAAADLVKLGPDSPSAAYRWWSAAGSGFMPSSNSITWYYPGPLGGGCVHPTVTGAWRANLNLPEGSQITQLWFGYYDYSNSAATTLRLMRYDQRGPEVQIGQVTSVAGSASYTGYKQASVSINPAHVVDNTWYSYVFVWSGPAATTTVQELCSAQVGYIQVPIYGVFAPSVRR